MVLFDGISGLGHVPFNRLRSPSHLASTAEQDSPISRVTRRLLLLHHPQPPVRLGLLPFDQRPHLLYHKPWIAEEFCHLVGGGLPVWSLKRVGCRRSSSAVPSCCRRRPRPAFLCTALTLLTALEKLAELASPTSGSRVWFSCSDVLL